jgi:hypothetical protein
MSKKLLWIILVGIVVIAAFWFLTMPKEPTTVPQETDLEEEINQLDVIDLDVDFQEIEQEIDQLEQEMNE